jgi:hypothetical protein
MIGIIKRILATVGIVTPIAITNHLVYDEFGSNIVFIMALAFAVGSWVDRKIQ